MQSAIQLISHDY